MAFELHIVNRDVRAHVGTFYAMVVSPASHLKFSATLSEPSLPYSRSHKVCAIHAAIDQETHYLPRPALNDTFLHIAFHTLYSLTHSMTTATWSSIYFSIFPKKQAAMILTQPNAILT